MELLLSLKGINKSYGGIRVLQDISLDLNKGEVVCLVGENGAGKSTMIKILSGAEKPDSGEICFLGHSYPSFLPYQAIQLGIETIYQDVNLVDTLTVADNIFQGVELKKEHIFIDRKAQEERAQEILDGLNLSSIRADVLVKTLSPGQQQNLQIAKALHMKARLLIMDEPTAALGEEETDALMRLVDNLKQEGIGIIYISHFLDEIFRVGDRVLVLKDGRAIGQHGIGEITQDQLIAEMVGRDVSGYYAKKRYSQGDDALEIRNYSRPGHVSHVNFTVSRGEILGLGGLVGAGRTELVRLLFGADQKESGQLFLDKREITPKSPRDAIKKGICLVPEDRKEEGLFWGRCVAENIAITRNESRLFLNLKEEKSQVSSAIRALRIKVFGQEQEVGKLSGGNQQKVIISRWLAMDGDIYIFDEPSKGIDIGAREEIYHLMEGLAKAGKIIIMVSSSMPELISMSDRIAVMREGVLTRIVPSEYATEEVLLKLYMGIADNLSVNE